MEKRERNTVGKMILHSEFNNFLPFIDLSSFLSFSIFLLQGEYKIRIGKSKKKTEIQKQKGFKFPLLFFYLHLRSVFTHLVRFIFLRFPLCINVFSYISVSFIYMENTQYESVKKEVRKWK